MTPQGDDRCGARVRRGCGEIEAGPASTAEVGLSALGAQMLDALRDDPRFRDIIDDPFGDHGPMAA